MEKIIYSSTGGALYGNPETVPCQDDAPVEPVSPYGMSKYVAEQYLEFYHRQFRLIYTTLRYGNVYGPRQDPTGEAGVVAIFSQAMLDGKQPEIFGDGNQERDFTYVEDIVDGCLLAAEKPINDGTPINLGTGTRFKIKEVVDMIFEILNWKPKEFVFETDKPVGVLSRALDNSKAKQLLGWEPKFTLKDGLAKTVEWYVNTHKSAGKIKDDLLLEHQHNKQSRI